MAEEKARDPTKPEIKPVSSTLSKIHDLPGSVFAPPSPKSLEALTSSIVLKGVQEPVILRQREDGEFQIVSGNRRRKASEFAKKTEIPAFIYDMTEKEARDFRLRGNAKGTPPGKLLPESEIGKKREAPAKTPDKAAENKTPVTQPKPSEKAAAVKPAPAPEPKKSEEKLKEAAPAEKSDADSKVSVTPLKPPEKNAELKPAPEQKKPEDTPKTAAPTEKIDADGKKPGVPQKPSEKPTEFKSAPVSEPKNPEEKPKTDAPTEKASTDSKGSTTQSKPQEKAVEVKPAPAVMPGPAALGPTGTKITKIFDERLMPPDEHAMKDLPVPKDGESYFITLHPAYLEKSEFNTVSVDTNSDDYKELRKSIELNGVKDPVLTRINPKGGLEILSGQRRHIIARELNYPVPAIIQKIDDNDAMILVADSNLHRPHISTYDLSRTLRNKMTAMKRKAGRKKRGVPGADELQSDAMLAKEMGISTSKLKPTVKRVQRLRDAEKRGNLDDKTMRAILEDKDIQPIKPPEPPKPAPTQPDPPFPVASMVTPNVSPAPAPATGTSPVTLAPPNMKPVMPEPPKQENTARPPATQTVEKPETAPTSASNVIPISAESKQPGDSKAADGEPIEFNSPRENLYSLKITLGGDRLRRYFPDVTMPALAITESIYSALEERRQCEARMKQKTEILHPSKPAPTR